MQTAIRSRVRDQGGVPVVKVFVLFGNEPNLVEACERRWRAAREDGSKIRGYVRNRRSGPYPGFPAEVPYDVVAELWFDDIGDAVAELDRLLGETTVSDVSRPRFVFTRENVVIPGAPRDRSGGLKGIFFIRHQEGKDRQHFQEYWRARHAPLVPGTPGLERYVQCYVMPEGDSLGQADYDGIAELSFADQAGFERCWGSKEIQEVQLPDTAKFVGRGAIGFFVDETRMV